MKKFAAFLVISIALVSFAVKEMKPADQDGSVTFTIKNFGINTGGELKGLKGAVKWDAGNPSASSFNVSVDVNTISTGISARDSHLRQVEYFDAEKYPTISFTSTTVTANNVTGNLTIKGVTKPVSFPFTVKPSGSGYLFEGKFSISRKDFGVGGGSMVLSNEVNVSLKVQTNP